MKILNDKPEEQQKKDIPLKDTELSELYSLMDQHKNHIWFLQEMVMFSKEEKLNIATRVKEVCKLISDHTTINNSIS